jgi:hypothetical protein
MNQEEFLRKWDITEEQLHDYMVILEAVYKVSLKRSEAYARKLLDDETVGAIKCEAQT